MFKLFSLLFLVFCFSSAVAQESPDIVRYKVTPEVVYGQGRVMAGSQETTQDLWMDVYYPLKDSLEPRPAVILTFGGSFHMGNPRSQYVMQGSQTTSMSQYAMRLAEAGYVCFTISHRLAPDHPVLSPYEGFSEQDLDPSYFRRPLAVAQLNGIRTRLGLPEVDADGCAQIMQTGVLAAAEDLRKAIRHVKASSSTYGVDPDRIALGGFSAGAVTSLNVPFGMKEEVAAVFSLSGAPFIFTMEKLPAKCPPTLIVLSQNDYRIVSDLLLPFLETLRKGKKDYALVWVPGFEHIYPAGAMSLGNDGTKMSVEQRILQFLKQHLAHDLTKL